MHVDFRLFAGPNLLVPFAALVAEFDSLFLQPLSGDDARNRLERMVPHDLVRLVTLEPGVVAFETLAASLANALQDSNDACGLPAATCRTETGKCRIMLGFHDPRAVREALIAGLEIAVEIFRAGDGGADKRQAIAARVGRATALIGPRQPDFIILSLMRVAKERHIPVAPVSYGSRIWLFGQGSAGIHHFEAASHRDSTTGVTLQRDKFVSNQLLTRLGLPGVMHAVATDAGAALEIARHLGFPIVVKPVDSGKGRGVTANIGDTETLTLAFAKAIQISPRGCIVERHVEGDDHRIAVIAGKAAWGGPPLAAEAAG